MCMLNWYLDRKQFRRPNIDSNLQYYRYLNPKHNQNEAPRYYHLKPSDGNLWELRTLHLLDAVTAMSAHHNAGLGRLLRCCERLCPRRPRRLEPVTSPTKMIALVVHDDIRLAIAHLPRVEDADDVGMVNP